MGRHTAHQPTLDTLKALFTLKGDHLVWNNTSRNKVITAGDIAGSVQKNRYLIVNINRVQHTVHRLIYQMHHEIDVLDGAILVDHIDGDRLNNNPNNLRACTHAQNMQNKKAHKNNKLNEKCIVLKKPVVNARYYEVCVKGNGIVARRNFPYSEEGLKDAIAFRDRMLIEVHGEFANLG